MLLFFETFFTDLILYFEKVNNLVPFSKKTLSQSYNFMSLLIQTLPILLFLN